MSTDATDEEIDSARGSERPRHRRPALVGIVAGILVATVVYLYAFYQPVRVSVESAEGPTAGRHGVNHSFNDATLVTDGFSSVTIERINTRGAFVPVSGVRIGAATLCTHWHQGDLQCAGHQALGEGVGRFRAVTIAGGHVVNAIVRVNFECASYTANFDMRLPMTIHYLGVITRTVAVPVRFLILGCGSS